jgi:hypothetical protein
MSRTGATGASQETQATGERTPARLILGGAPDGGGPSNPTRLGSAWNPARTGGPGQPPPETPGDPVVTAGSDGVVTLQWMDLSSNETGFRIEHQVQAGSTWGGAGTFTVGPARETVTVNVAGGTHRFRVAAYNDGGNSAWTSWSAPITITGPVDPDPLPTAPANLTVTPSELPAAVLHWDDASSNETGFQIERNPAFAEGLRGVGANVSMYTDQVGLGTYQYRVRAVNNAGSSAFTTWAQIVLTASPPAAPTSPMASDAGNERDINVSWTDNSDNEESFVLQREKQVGSMWAETTQLAAAANATTLLDSPGAGTYRYRIASVNGQGQSAYSVWASATAADGWTHFTPSSDTRIVYVSSSTGNDSNDGLSEARPKATIAAAYALLRSGYPDWMLLKRGDVWNTGMPNWDRSGRSSLEPIVVSAYGTGSERPLLQTGPSTGWRRSGGGGTSPSISYVVTSGLRFVATRGGAESATGVSISYGCTDLRFEDCSWEKYLNNVSVQGGTPPIQDITFYRCQFLDAFSTISHSQGIFARSVRNLWFLECLVDHNGWNESVPGAEATIFNHNFYIRQETDGFVLKDSISARASSHGISMNYGGRIENNLIVECGVGIFCRTMGAVCRDNVVLEGRDVGTNQRGMGIDLGPVWPEGPYPASGTLSCVRNIIAHRNLALSSIGNFGINMAGNDVAHANAISLTDNIVFDWRASSLTIGSSVVNDAIQIARNSFQESSGTTMISHVPSAFSNFSYSDNKYFSTVAANSEFSIARSARSYAAWVDTSGETGSSNTQVAYPDAARDITTYMTELGVFPATTEHFLSMCRQNSRSNWNPEFTAKAVNRYIREGFGLEE